MKSFYPNGFFLLGILLSSLVYLPGLSGPFIFDDLANILSNPYVAISQLNPASLHLAAISGTSGPFGRPIPMISFALNYYFSNGFNHPAAFKVTNLVIHIVNTYLVFLVFRYLLFLQEKKTTAPREYMDSGIRPDQFAFILAIFWSIHPLQVNPVHYVVQRMTLLSATFLLLGLAAYLVARTGKDRFHHSTRVVLYASVPVFLVLGLMSKENSILLIPFILLIEFFYFQHRRPWRLLLQRKASVYVVFFVLLAGLLIAGIEYALPGYATRNFSLLQRLATEFRILIFYLGLIAFPLLYKFGLFHDDIAVSTGLLSPLTTLYSLILLVLITLLAIVYRKKYPYLLFGWLWFLVAHSLESTIFPLELAHEHRNYIALMGPLFAGAGLIRQGYRHLGRTTYVFIVIILVGSMGILTYLRSNDWSSYQNLVIAESSYHPGSPRAQAAMGAWLVKNHLLQQGLESMTQAYTLDPRESGFLLNMLIIRHMMGKKVPGNWREDLMLAYGEKRVSPLGMQVLDYAYNCTIDACRGISEFIASLARSCSNNLLNSRSSRARCMYYDGLLADRRGNREYAIQQFRDSADFDKDFLKPVMEIALVQLENSNYTGARKTIEMLIQRNEHTRFKKNQIINSLISRYNNTTRDSGQMQLKPIAD